MGNWQEIIFAGDEWAQDSVGWRGTARDGTERHVGARVEGQERARKVPAGVNPSTRTALPQCCCLPPGLSSSPWGCGGLRPRDTGKEGPAQPSKMGCPHPQRDRTHPPPCSRAPRSGGCLLWGTRPPRAPAFGFFLCLSSAAAWLCTQIFCKSSSGLGETDVLWL